MHDDDTTSNDSSNPHLDDLLARDDGRRRFLRQTAAAVLMAGVPMVVRSSATFAAGPARAPVPITFQGVAVTTADAVTVPPGYTARVLFAWGDPVSDGPAFADDASNSADDQMRQAGMHHDGMHFFPFPEPRGFARASSTRGLLAINHEYTDDALLHVGGMTPWTARKVAKSQAAHGVSVVEVEQRDGRWQVVRPSPYARRITAGTPIAIGGPAAGHPLLQTAADPAGRTVLGTLNNCAHGVTPWGTYLACEENFNGYFVNPTGDVEFDGGADGKAQILNAQGRYGITKTGFGYRWHEHDPRFDASKVPHEPHRFGYVVEIDPWTPEAAPVKRTALGRLKHEGATSALAGDGRLAIYMGDDERFEYVYKFVTRDRCDRRVRAANRDLLDHGTLYVARFDADGAGTWLPLVQGGGALTAANGFPDQASVCVRTRQAADLLGATKMDRPEWIAVHPRTGDVYVTLTNNSQRGTSGRPAVDAANPRANNVFGHILRFVERDGDAAATSFRWSIFAQCGDPALGEAAKAGDLQGDIFGSPDGAWFDERGVLWVQTDISTSALNKGDYRNVGNNQMLAIDPSTGTSKRFLVGPRGCEVTGVVTTPDLRTMFVNIQHPGEPDSERNDPARPNAISSWPDGPAGGRPRSATVVIVKDDGGIIGT
ncbi:MAG TPA: PhoX family phosphatase [Casimicrobiaceae bacterium]|nr:PhoX family phosphatase [Casimicrobiaceae bacterium]